MKVPDDTEAPPDDAAVIRASWHEPDRFAVIFQRHFTEIHRYVARRLGADTADDLTADVFLNAFRSREKFVPERGTVRTWLYGIATNLIGSHRRAEKRHFAALARTHVDDITEDHGDRVTDRVIAGATGKSLSAALTALPSGDRDALLLVALADLSYGEVAQALDIPKGTVASRINRARRKVRALLGPIELAQDLKERIS